jgi:hypothetical protein
MKFVLGRNQSKILIVILGIMMMLVNLVSTSPAFCVGCIWLYLMLVVVVMGFDIIHPNVWFVGMLVLYNTGYLILYELGFNMEYGYSKEPIVLASLATLVFTSIMPGRTKNIGLKHHVAYKSGAETIVLHTMTIILIATAIIIKVSGFSGKTEIYQNHPIITKVFSLALIYINFFVLETCASLDLNNRINFLNAVEVFVSITLLTLLSGERDLVFRLILDAALIAYYFKKISLWRFWFWGAIVGIVILPLSVSIKYFFTAGVLTKLNITNFTHVIYKFFSAEFLSASRNLQILVKDASNVKGVMNGTTLINDITTVFGYAPHSALGWFQDRFFYNRGTGMGFTLIGEGYINFGYVGVVLVYSVVALITRWLYLNRNRNIYCLYIYISSVPIFVYANRADLANILSPFVKHILLGGLLFYILRERVSIKNRIYIAFDFVKRIRGRVV